MGQTVKCWRSGGGEGQGYGREEWGRVDGKGGMGRVEGHWNEGVGEGGRH